MDINTLYEAFCRRLDGKTLLIDETLCDNFFAHLLCSLSQEQMMVENCTVTLAGGKVSAEGIVYIPPYASFGPGTLKASFWEEKGRVVYEVQIVVNGCGSLRELCGFGGILIPDGHLFAGFELCYPVLTVHSNRYLLGGGYRISGTARAAQADSVESLRGMLPAVMAFEGSVQTQAVQSQPLQAQAAQSLTLQTQEEQSQSLRQQAAKVYYQLNFKTGMKDYAFPLGRAEVTLALRTSVPDFMYGGEPEILAYLLFDLTNRRGENMRFQMGISAERQPFCHAAAFFAPALTPANVEQYIGDLFGIPAENLMLPDFAVLNGFGLQKIVLRLQQKGQTLAEGLVLHYVELTFRLAHPWHTPVQGLTLTDFTVFSETTQGEKERFTTLTVSAAASLSFGDYRIGGRVRGYFPARYYEGYLALYRESAQETSMTLQDMAETFHAPVPDGWAKPLADFSITADMSAHSYQLAATATGILSVSIGSLEISIDSVSVRAQVRPAGNTFTFQGVFGFTAGTESFQFSVGAAYDAYWIFSGALIGDSVSIGSLLAGMFHKTASGAAADIFIDGLSFSFAPTAGEFELFASFSVFWFEVLGCRPRTGGRIKLVQKQDDSLSASALFYLDIGALRFLIQADDFYTEQMKFLFRVSWNQVYVQGVYTKEEGEELVRLSLGGMTFGDIVLAFIHLLNPNAKSSLPSPWNLLDKIRLSDFSVVLNATRKTASVLYHAALSIAGLMEIEDIGLRYLVEEKKVEYILTGRLLQQTYDIGHPLSWDAVDGTPPANTAAGGTKTKVSYLGLGSHLQVELPSGSVAETVSALREQLKPVGGAPEIAYSDQTFWMFGADITIGDLFRLETALIDPMLYGALVTVHVTEKSPLYFFNGLELELMYQKISDSVGMFRCTVTLPDSMSRFELGVLSVILGQVSLEIYTNGSFLIDLGFPHDADFTRSFGLEYGIFTGRGGLLFATLTGDAVKSVPEVTNGAFTPVVLLGVGLCVGVGRSFDLGLIKGGVSLTVTGILEGAFAVFHPEDKAQDDALYYRVSAVAGISGTLFLSADWKIISISVAAEVSAVCSLTIESYRKSVVQLTLHLKLAASVKILFIKIRFSFTFHQETAFTFGEDGRAPWKLAQEEKGRFRSQRVRAAQEEKGRFRTGRVRNEQWATGDRSAAGVQREQEARSAQRKELFACVKTGDWQVRVSVLPLFSVCNPNVDGEGQYCAAFLSVMPEADFDLFAKLLFAWILAAFSEEEITDEMAASVTKEAVERLTYGDFDAFFAENLRVCADAQIEEQEEKLQGGLQEGVFFPMLPCLQIICGGRKLDFGNNPVTEAYCHRISEYLASLNADPFHEIPNRGRREERIPVCAAIMTDYCKMLLSELVEEMHRQFREIVVEADSFCGLVQRYGAEAEEFVSANPEVLLRIDSIPRYSFVTGQGETLERMQETFRLEAGQLWEDVKEVSMLPADGTVEMGEYRFDNSIADMSAEEAAAVFFVRLYQPEVMYGRYADSVLTENGLPYDWQSPGYGSRRLAIPGWSREYVALAGDTVVRIAKAAALVNGETAEGWQAFRQRFLGRNPVKAAWYSMEETVSLGDYTLEEMVLRLCPDYTEMTAAHFLWKQPIISPWKNVVLTNAVFRTGAVKAAQSGIAAAELATALRAGTADLTEKQTVTVTPYAMTKETLGALVLSAEKNRKTGAALSRFFLQGLRVPQPEGDGIVPLFQLLGQQIPVELPMEEFRFSLEKNEKTVCSWAEVMSGGETVLSGEMLQQALPDGILPALPLPEKTADFLETCQCWQITEKCTVLGGVTGKPGGAGKASGAGTGELLGMLPEDLRRYLERNSTETVELRSGGETVTEFAWASLTELPLVRSGDGLYEFSGVACQARRELYACLDEQIREIRILYRTTRFDTGRAQYAALDTGKLLLVRTDLSTETHAGRLRRGSLENMAGVDTPEQFLLLVWEGSVIGGGFRLVVGGLPDSIFDGDGRGSLYMLTVLEERKISGSFLNSVVLEGAYRELVFESLTEKVLLPALPVGTVGISCEADFTEDNKMQELFQVLSYQARAQDGRLLESMPILPGHREDDTMYYGAAVPLYRLLAGDASPYDVVGKTFTLAFFRRDVLGNYAGAGTLTLTPDYNDFLADLNQIPYTKVEYGVRKQGDRTELGMRFGFALPAEEITPAAKEQALKVMRQAACEIAVCLTCTISGDTVYRFTEDDIAAYRSFTQAVYQTVCGERATDRQAAGGTAPSLEVSFMLDGSGLPDEVFEIALTAEIIRTDARCADSGVRSAACRIARREGFEDDFAQALPEILPASGDGALYGIPAREYLDGFSIEPFAFPVEVREAAESISTGNAAKKSPLTESVLTESVPSKTALTETVRTPELYAFAPFSRRLMTGSIESGGEGKHYTDIDLEAWMKRFLEDLEELFAGGSLAVAAERCPDTLDALLTVKRQLAEALAARLVPFVKGLTSQGQQAAQETARQLYLQSLANVYGTDMICVYRASGAPGKRCRLEPVLDGSEGICAGKADTESGFFCLYSSDAGRRCSETEDWKLSFLHFEYDIQPGRAGYEDSKWLRLLSPLTGSGRHMQTDLGAELGIPHPLRLFPESPKLLAQRYDTAQSALLRYAYTLELSCRAYEQYTIYLRLRFRTAGVLGAEQTDPVFAVLAAYDDRRETLLAHIAGRDAELAPALQELEGLAAQLAAAVAQRNARECTQQGAVPGEAGMTGSSVTEADREERDAAETGITEAAADAEYRRSQAEPDAAAVREIMCRLTFSFTLESEAGIRMEPYDEASRAFLSSYEVQAAAEILSGGRPGEETAFRVRLENLPLMLCQTVQPFVWIVQNQELLLREDFRVNDGFLFQTEEASLDPVRICAEYTAEETAQSIRQAVEKLWDRFGIARTAGASVAVSCCFALGEGALAGFPVRIPAVFLPEADSPEAVCAALDRWLSSMGTDAEPCGLLFDLNVFGEAGQETILRGEVSVLL